MKIVLTALTILALSTGLPGKKSEPVVSADLDQAKAFIDKQTGMAYFRANTNEREIPLPKKEKTEAKKLFPDEEIRCGKNCVVALKLCTGGAKTITEDDGWYRIPNLACRDDIPGFPRRKGSTRGRQSIFRFDEEETERITLPLEIKNLTKTPATSATTQTEETASKKKVTTYERNARLSTRAETYQRRLEYGTRYYVSFPIQNYSNNWYFLYPYPEALVIPKLFIFDITERKSETGKRKLRLFVTLSAFEDANSLRISREWKKEMFLQNGILTNEKGERINQSDAQSFLEEARKYYGQIPARIYCTITVGEVSETGNINVGTMGFQFYVMTSNDEKVILEQLETLNKETGITRYLGRAAIFEERGLIKFTTDEYIEALKAFPENEVIEFRLKAINNIVP